MPAELLEKAKTADIVTFGSPSAVKAWVSLVGLSVASSKVKGGPHAPAVILVVNTLGSCSCRGWVQGGGAMDVGRHALWGRIVFQASTVADW